MYFAAAIMMNELQLVSLAAALLTVVFALFKVYGLLVDLWRDRYVSQESANASERSALKAQLELLEMEKNQALDAFKNHVCTKTSCIHQQKRLRRSKRRTARKGQKDTPRR